MLRFRQLGAATGSLIVGAMGTWGTMAGTVPIAHATSTERVQIIQGLVGLVSISLLVVGATLAEREVAVAAVRQTASQLAEAQALTHIGSWKWEPGNNAVACSDEFYRILGYAPQSLEITYRGFLRCVHPEDRATLVAAVRLASLESRPFDVEHRIRRADGSLRLLETRGRVIVRQAPEVVAAVGTTQDITEQRQAESLREDILSTVSHELRTPLASVIGFSRALQKQGEKVEPVARAGMLDRIVGESQRLERLLTDLLDVDRLRHGLVAPEREPIDVDQLLHDIAAAHRTNGRELTVTAAPTRASVDAGKLERIVDNLLRNAARHTPLGTAIELRLDSDGEDLLITVDDTGPGVPDEFKAAIFEIFDRGAHAGLQGRGSGIGLSLVKRLASIHGGRAWVEDNATGGASFRVSFPHCVLASAVDDGAVERTAPERIGSTLSGVLDERD